MTTLDADDPLVLDTRALGGRAGAMITVHRTVPAPDGWRVSSTSVEPGTPIDLRLRLESVVEGVLVSGTAECVTSAECSRCLDPVAGTLTIGVQQLFEYHAPAARADEDTDPLPTLRQFRFDRELKGVTFGWNAVIATGAGATLRAGEAVRLRPRVPRATTAPPQ